MALKATDFNMPQDYERYRKAVGEFVLSEMDPIAEEIEESGRIPEKLIKMLAEAGLLKVCTPKKYGGWELNQCQFVPLLEEMAKSHGTIRMLFHAWNGIFMRAIWEYGTQEMKDKYLPLMNEGKWAAGFALTEPGTGSGMDIKTTAVRDGDNFILNGEKHLISFPDIVDAFNVLSWTDKSLGRKGLTSFLVDKGAPGFTIEIMPDGMGMRGSQHGHLIFKDCVVPAKNVLGEIGQGIDVALGLLDLSRLGIAVSCLGLAQRFLELSVEYSKKRTTFGKTTAERQAVQQMLADMATDVYALRLMCNDVALKFDQGLPIRKDASMCKLFGIESVRRVSDSALIIHGGLGYFKGFNIERMYRDARAPWFEEGTPTIQRLVIARAVLSE